MPFPPGQPRQQALSNDHEFQQEVMSAITHLRSLIESQGPHDNSNSNLMSLLSILPPLSHPAYGLQGRSNNPNNNPMDTSSRQTIECIIVHEDGRRAYNEDRSHISIAVSDCVDLASLAKKVAAEIKIAYREDYAYGTLSLYSAPYSPVAIRQFRLPPPNLDGCTQDPRHPTSILSSQDLV